MNIQGLTTIEAEKRLKKYGPNEIQRANKLSPIKIFIEQFTSPFILILIIAALISWLIGYIPGQESNLVDTILILVIVLISGIAGFIQEYHSEETVEALMRMASPQAKVWRDGSFIEIDATKIVKGDVVLVESGDVVPADMVLVEVFNLSVNEASITGESQSVHRKTSEKIYMNTYVESGSAKCKVVETGMNTNMGKIASKLQSMTDDQSVFQKEMSVFGRNISIAVGVLILLMAGISLFKYSPEMALLMAIALAVAAIPEGMPAVLALTLSLNAKIMAQSKALVRKLSVIESIGSVDVICTDKTGTLTSNEMVVKHVYLGDNHFDINVINPKEMDEGTRLFFITGALCNDSIISGSGENVKYLGDETEIALRKAAAKIGVVKEKLEDTYEKVGEISFTSKRKMMSVFYQDNKKSKISIFSKGAPEILIEHCNTIYQGGQIIPLTPELKVKIIDKNKKYAQSGLRVLGIATRYTKTIDSDHLDDLENDLTWLGLEAMWDAPHSEVKEALANTRRAGIRVVMITGDNALTAEAIASEVGLKTSGSVSGDELDKMSNEELEEKLDSRINIFARTTPAHKLRILEILKKKYRVAMTGDGVNDSLALKKADVGIAMGIKGTEVAKEASDIILLDDNFATITNAVKEGRKTFDNIRKFVNYLLTCNLAEIFVIFIATLFINISEPIILPVQLLWINLLTDGLPALALGVDPARPNVMHEKPRGKNESILGRRLRWLIVGIGVKKTVILLMTFLLTLPMGLDVARSALLTGFVLYEFIRIGSIRSQEKLTWFSNKYLLAALSISLLAQLFILYTPLNKFFSIVPLGWKPWLILIAGMIFGYWLAILITKFIVNHVKEQV